VVRGNYHARFEMPSAGGGQAEPGRDPSRRVWSNERRPCSPDRTGAETGDRENGVWGTLHESSPVCVVECADETRFA
jgi:hypothetical protein